ncbi:DMT family transporter [Bradyrhizobium genosp. A]|uniref:DMT family transporter n=1 Tax=Bradyrhizobium genosp. A TaxID=83626 RepID=UPI003CFA9D2A
MDNRQDTNIAIQLALLVALATLWGGSYTFIKLGVATIPPVTLIAARTTIAGLLLLAVMWARGIKMPTDGPTWQRFAFQAVLNSVIPWTPIAWGERHVDASLATILNSAGPIFTYLLTAVVTRHEATTPRKLFGVVAGILLIVGVDAFGVPISVAFLGETLSRTAWIGLACVVLGVAAMTIPARRPAVAKPS